MKSLSHLSIYTSKLIGFLLAISGNTLIACSYTMQKSAHNQISAARASNSNNNNPTTTRAADDTNDLERGDDGLTAGDNDADAVERNFIRHPTWLLGTLLMGLGEVGNFAAFAFAPASLVAPLGAWCVVLSAILAHVFLHEHISRPRLLGIILCVGGALLIGTTGPDISSSEANLNASAVVGLLKRKPFVWFLLTILSSTVLLIFVAHKTNLGRRFVFVYVGVSSLLGAVTVVCAKALSTFLKLTVLGDSQLGNWLPVVLALTLGCAMALQVKYLNMAMARFGNAQVVPIYYVLFTACAMTSGVIMYKEFDTLKPSNIPFFVGVFATMFGVFLVCRTPDRAIGNTAKPSTSIAENGTGRALRKGYERVNPAPQVASKMKQEPFDV